jgi:hypothetical protein
MEKQEMSSLVEVLDYLKEKGWDNEFKPDAHSLVSEKSQKHYNPQELEIIKTYRFEGESDPADSTILYLIKDKSSDFTGYIIDVYGAATENAEIEEFIKQIPVHREEAEIQ